MRPNRARGLLTAGLVTVLGGLPTATTAAAVGGAATDEAPGVLRVDSTDPACSDTASGAPAFCSVTAAAAVAMPGQTVEVVRSASGSGVQITRSGEPGRPITVRGAGANGGVVGGPLRVAGVHDVVLQSLDTGGLQLEVTGSSRVTVNSVAAGAIKVTDSPDTALTRSSGRDVEVTGSRRATVVRTEANSLRLTDSPEATVTSNTVSVGCVAGIELNGNSSGSNLFNNLVHSHFSPEQPYLCQDWQSAEIEVSAGSVPGTRAAYNTVAPTTTTYTSANAYLWGGTAYQTPQELAAASGGQAGDHDHVVRGWSSNRGYGSEVTDSADETAPGFIPAAHPADDPARPNLGTGLGYHDRGAGERQEELRVSLRADHLRAPAGTEITLTTSTGTETHWPTSAFGYTYDFGDGTPPVTSDSPVVKHVYTKPGTFDPKVTVTTDFNRPVSAYPARVEVTYPGPINVAATVRAQAPGWDDSAASPLGVVVDPSASTSPWDLTKVVVDYGDGTPAATGTPGTGYFRHWYAAPGDYTVKVTVSDAGGRTTTAEYPFRAAYTPARYLSREPYRLVDTREDAGLELTGGREVPFTIPTGTMPDARGVSAEVSTVVLNVTVTNATEDTHLTVWPTGQPRPTTSNLNVAAGRASSNLVTVPVGLAHRISTQLNAGRAEVIVDVVGFYQPSGDLFTPLSPTRLVDTRESRKLGAGEVRSVKVAGLNGVPANATSVVLNLTSTDTAVDTHLKLWAGGAAKPASSNLNPEPGKDKSNQVIVPIGPDGTVNVYNHNGSTHAVLDVFGYYAPDGQAAFTPTVPVRLLDTRTNPFAKPGPDSTTVVPGIPAGAGTAVLNVTSTNTTEDSYLTVHAHGAPRPGTSNLNLLRGATVPNHVTTPVGPDGAVDVYNHVGSTDVIADLFGYFSPVVQKP